MRCAGAGAEEPARSQAGAHTGEGKVSDRDEGSGRTFIQQHSDRVREELGPAEVDDQLAHDACAEKKVARRGSASVRGNERRRGGNGVALERTANDGEGQAQLPGENILPEEEVGELHLA